MLSISCAAAGDCSAGGYLSDRHDRRRAFVVSETNGNWDNAIHFALNGSKAPLTAP